MRPVGASITWAVPWSSGDLWLEESGEVFLWRGETVQITPSRMMDAKDAKGKVGISRTAPSISFLAAFLLSLVSVLACVYLGVKTNHLQARILAIETAQGGISAAALQLLPPNHSLDQLMQDKVERLLAQVWWPWMLRMALGYPSKRCECVRHPGVPKCELMGQQV